jgi:GNAT superfamily N-acetyltransferase
MSNRIRRLEAFDVPQAFALSQAAAWNQTPEDWRLAIEMNPDGCFAMEFDGAVVATTTSIRYGSELAWIGMVLTHPEFRGRGYARALMRCALDHLSDVATVKLDATEMGAPLYHQVGFVDECAIERWRLSPQAAAPQAAAPQFTASGAADEYVPQPALDKRAFGADRSALLERLARIEAASMGDAFAMGRGGRFGPSVSRSKDAARALAEWYLGRHPNESILWDLFPETNLAQGLGFELSRRLRRMVRGRALRADGSLIYAGAGFEFG